MFGNNAYSGKVLCFGELLLRICPDEAGNWLSNKQLPFYVGGAELNVATALSLWQIPARYITALPLNSMARQIEEYVKDAGVDTADIIKIAGRLGLYYLTTGQDLKHDALVYDRANSAFSNLTTGTIDWDKVLQDVQWFHFSAICPAINQNVADVCKEALEAASKKGITISVDLNYRAKLWQYGKTPLAVMPSLVNYCHLVMGNVWAAEKMLGIPVTPEMHETGQKSIYLKQALLSAQEIMKQFPNCKAVANTFRFDDAVQINYYTTLSVNEEFYTSQEYNTGQLVDKVGSGDCFMAGLIYGFYHNLAPQEILAFATAAAFGKLFLKGDATSQTVDEIKSTLK